MADFEVSGVITLDDSQLKSGIANAKSGFSNIGSNIQSAGVKITKFGIGASLALAPVTLFLKSSVSAFRDFDVAMTNSQTILGATSEEMEILSAQVLEIGANTGLGPQAVADAFFTVVSGVADATTHMDILQNSVFLAEAGLADLAVTTDGMVAVMNAYQFAAEDASFVSDVFTRTVQVGVGTMDQFVSALKPIAGIASVMGVSFQELATQTAFLTSMGASASEATTQLSAVMTAFLKPNTAMTEALAAMGVESGLALVQSVGLRNAVQQLSTSLGGNEVALGAVLGRQEAIKGGFALMTEASTEFMISFSQGVDGATEAARKLQNATDAAIGDAFTSKLDALKIAIGRDLSGAIADVQTELMPFIESITDWAEENPETVKQLLFGTAALIALAGGLVIAGGAVTIFGALFTPAAAFVVAIGVGIAIVDSLAKSLGLEGGLMEVLERAEIGLRVFVNGTKLIIDGLTAYLQTVEKTWLGIFDQIQIIAANISPFQREGQMEFLHGPGAAPTVSTGFEGVGFQLPGVTDPNLFGNLGGNLGQPDLQQPGGLPDFPLIIPSHDPPPIPLQIGGKPYIANPVGRADGGATAAFQPMIVGERGPERITFPVASQVTSNEDMNRGGMFDGAIFNIHASGEAEGRAAGRGFGAELETILMRNG